MTLVGSTMDPYFERPRLHLDENPCSLEMLEKCDQYPGSPMYWQDAHFGQTTVEGHMYRSMDDFCASVENDFSNEPLSLGAVVTGSSGSKCVKNCVQKNTAANGIVETEEKDHGLILKTKLLSAFTNVRNGWLVKSSASFTCGTPTWLLGVKYLFTKADLEQRNRITNIPTSFERFKLDFRSRIWMTYRKDFPKLDGSQLTSDIGWGCMMRSGQMLLAQAFLKHFLGRDWVWCQELENEDIVVHRQIIRYFGDTLHQLSPFSLQMLVGIGRKLGRNPGDWYGPASISNVLRDALEQADHEVLPELCNLSIYIAMDGVLFIQDVLNLSMGIVQSGTSLHHDTTLFNADQDSPTGAGNDLKWRSMVILVPLRLGSEVLNDIYVPCLKTILCHDLCIGIIGGRPKHSMYFIGFQDEKLIHLDPHCSQNCVDVLKDNFPLESFHCTLPRKLSFAKMDPTCTLGFYCKTRTDFDRFIKEVPKITMPPSQEAFPLFHFQEGCREDFESKCRDLSNPFNFQSVTLVSHSDRGSVTIDDFTLL